MTEFAANWVGLLADWSIRWGVLILGLIVVLIVRPPRPVAERLWLTRLTLFGGLLLPLCPHWWTVPRPARNPPTAVSRTPAPRATPPRSEITAARSGAAGAGSRFDPPQSTGPTPEPVAAKVRGSRSEAPVGAAVEEPAPADRAGIDWSVVLAVGWLAGCGLMLARLACGRWWLSCVRRAADPAPGELQRELDSIRELLGVRRRVELLLSPAVAGPALFGGRRSAVVVPPDWTLRPAEDRRAALVHEVTHVAYADDRAGFAEELVRALFFFHPLVHWLLGRLARDREQRCDASVVSRGVAPRHLAGVLLEGLKQMGPGRTVLGATPMFHRSSAAERIHQLMEADMTIWTKPLSVARGALAAVVAVGLCVGLGGFAAGAASPPAAPAEKAPDHDARTKFRGTVTDSAGAPVGGATVLAVGDVGHGDRLITTSGPDGSFVFDKLPFGTTAFPSVYLIVVKDGYGRAEKFVTRTDAPSADLTLPAAATFGGAVKDSAGRPVAGAEIQVGFVHRSGNGASWGYVPPSAVRGTAAERFYFAKTDRTGRFRFTNLPLDSELILRVSAAGLAELDTGAGGPKKRQHVAATDAKPTDLVLQPEGVIRGRVTSHVDGVRPDAAEIRVDGTKSLHGLHRTVRPDAEGRFTVDRLPAGPSGVYAVLPAGAPATAAGVTVTTTTGATTDVAIDLVAGVEVTGRVQVKGTGEPVAGVQMATNGLVNPTGFDFSVRPTGADGRFGLRMPPGKVNLLVWTTPKGLDRGDRRDVVIPDGVAAYAIPEPFEVVKVAQGLNGRVTDAAGKPMPRVKVCALQHCSVCGNFAAEPVTASWDGGFTLHYSPAGPLEAGRIVPLRVEAPDGRRFEAAALVLKDGVAEVRVPTLPAVAGPQDVKPNEFAGLVVDESGKPLPGVKVHIWDWVDRPENYTFTGPDGVFRLKDCGKERQVEVRFRKDGYSPVMVVRQEVGVKGLVIAMDRATYFEGLVRGPDGSPAPGAVVRADQGPKNMDGGVYTEVWTETTADAEGRYRLYVQPDEYAFHVKAAGAGVARLAKTGIGHGQARRLDIALQPGITFRAKVVDSVTGRPAAGLRLYDWQKKDVDGRSDDHGIISIKDMLPGEFRFSVESDRYARWWSGQAAHQWEQKSVDDERTGWQRNFDGLTFDMKPGMPEVTIVAEPAVRVTGRVLDPNGKPVGGATVAPARTGSGNSLTGDTRFSVETKADGSFVMTLPASGAAEYNLVAHDGKYGQWRTWANGVLPPLKTVPGQAIDGVTLNLTLPAVVRGKVVDAAGRPVAGREVRAHAADRLENRYYDPTTTTKADGTFELKFVRPAEQLVQVAPFWLNGSDAPPGSSRTLTPAPGQVVDGVSLVAIEEPER